MASSDASDYFPALDKCLDGTAQLLSWQQVYLCLRDGINCEDNGPVHRFLTDSSAQNILKRLRDPFATQSAQTKALFDRLTSAINAPPSTNGKYDIKQIKDDALWLGKTANIDEVSALRLATLELQRRSDDQILQEVSSPEELGLGRSYQQPALLRSILGASQNAPLNKSVLQVSDTDSKSRQVRILSIYLLERTYITKIRQLASFARSARSSVAGIGWLGEIGAGLENSWFEDSNSLHSFSAEILATLESSVSRLQNGCPWVLDEELLARLAGIWNDSFMTELALNLQFLLHLLQGRTSLLPSKLVTGWFDLMDKHMFFEIFETINPDVKELHVNAVQSLVALVSVAILQPSVAVAAIDDFAAEATPPSQSNAQSYLKETACVDRITTALLAAAGGSGSRRLILAGPAMFAWVVIMQTVRSYATASIEARESRQAQRALEQQPHDSDSESADFPARSRSDERRRSSFGSDSEPPASLIETIADVVQRTMPNDDPIHFFAECAVGLSNGLRAFETIARIAVDFCTPCGHEFGGHVGLEMRGLLLQLISASLIWMPYSPEILESLLAVLAGGATGPELQVQCRKFPRTHPVALFLADTRCRSQILDQALVRFPYENGPLLALGQCISHATIDIPDLAVTPLLQTLQHRSVFTTFLIEGLAEWDLADADEVRLVTPLDVFTAAEWQSYYDDGVEHTALLNYLGRKPSYITPFVIPEGSVGRVLKAGAANEGKVVMWQYQHSGLAYIGFKLQRDAKVWIQDGSVPPESLNDPIGLISNLLQAADDSQACQILGECSDNLYDSVDIAQVIFDLCESLLYRSQSGEGVSALLVTCMGFIRTVLRFLPGRVWPFLGRSGLLGINKSENRLQIVVATSEVPSGNFPFLLETVSLFEALVNDALSKTVERRASSKALTRFDTAEVSTLSAGVTGSNMSNILSQFHALMTDVFESCRSWRFVSAGQRMTIISSLSKVMTKSLRYCYDVGDNAGKAASNGKPTLTNGTLDKSVPNLFDFIFSSAAYVSDVFLASSSNNSACHALVESVLDGVESTSDPLSTRESWQIIGQTRGILDLARHLVALRHARDQKPGALEENLFKAVPVLLRIYCTHPLYRLPVVSLLERLVSTAGRVESPPSLLAYVPTETAKQFLQVLKKLDQPCPEAALSTGIWRFLTATVTKRQQWFSIFLLSGNTPRETLKNSRNDGAEQTHKTSMLNIAMEKAASLPDVSTTEAEALLDFMAQSADFWPQVCTRIRERKATVDGLVSFIRQFDLSDRMQRSKTSEIPLRTQSVSHIMDIMALLINSDAKKDTDSFASTLMSSLMHLVQGEDLEHSAVSNPGYNASLHQRLDKNFSARYANCKLASLKRTMVANAVLGESFYYDLDIADEILSYNGAWDRGRGNGFRSEMILANENLSLVEATIEMFHGWKSLIIELAATLPHDEQFVANIGRVALNCLIANNHSILPAEVFHRLAQARAELAFTLLQRISPKMKNNKLAQQILSTAWEVVKEPAEDLGMALTGDDSAYYRTCLKTLLLALQPHRQELPLDARKSVYSDAADKTPDVTVVLLEIVRTVVAKGFQSLVSVLHDNASRLEAGDMALLLTILRIILTVPGIEKHHTDMLNIFSDERTPTYAATLFSWADKLLVDGDPIYGEMSINLLLELSTIQPVAESMIASGCLGQLLASNLMIVYQKGLGPFDPPSRVYSIWSRGILPLAVNLLSALGPLVAADIATFINRFSGQLTRVGVQFNVKDPKNPHAGLISLGVAGEIHSLALLTRILEMCREAGANAGVVAANIQDIAWDRARVTQDVEDLLSRKASLRSLIVPRDAREEAWLRSKPSEKCSNGAESQLEENIVDLFAGALDMLNASEN